MPEPVSIARRELLQAAVGCDVTRMAQLATGLGPGFDVLISDRWTRGALDRTRPLMLEMATTLRSDPTETSLAGDAVYVRATREMTLTLAVDGARQSAVPGEPR